MTAELYSLTQQINASHERLRTAINRIDSALEASGGDVFINATKHALALSVIAESWPIVRANLEQKL